MAALCSLSICVFGASSPEESGSTDYSDMPWLTGPILAAAGHVVPGGHINWEPYFFASDAFGTYNNAGKVIRNTPTITSQPMLSLTIGMTQWMDFQALLPYNFNNSGNQSDNHWADITLMFGLQAMTDNPKIWWYPDLRITVEETFPTGNYQNLNPTRLNTDSTGIGSYQSAIGLNFQKVWQLSTVHYLRMRMTYTYSIPTNITVNGYNAFGGGIGTHGKINVGNKGAVDISFEYTLTPNWVLASDFIYNNSLASPFSGTPGTTSTGAIAQVGQKNNHGYSITPSIEYNWNAQLGVIAGAWLSVGGNNISDFSGGAIALNYYS